MSIIEIGANPGLLISILAVILIILQIFLTWTQHKSVKDNQGSFQSSFVEFNNLVSNLDHKMSSVFNFLTMGYNQAFPTYRESLDDITLSKLLGTEPSSKSLFNYRMGHYSDEKDFICQKFLKTLTSNEKIMGKDKIYLLIDSGSTVFPLFKLLCDYYRSLSDEKKIWLENKIEIFTNNIRGISYLLTYGRKGDDVNAKLIFKCNVIPGNIDGNYSAILGKEGVNHLNFIIKSLRNEFKRNNKSCTFISVITGNYISIKDGLLWRGDFHGLMKDAYILNSDYIYILTPLGKIFDLSVEEINKIIKENRLPYSSMKDYKKLTQIEQDTNIRKFAKLNLATSEIRKLLPLNLIRQECENDIGKNVFIITTERKSKEESIYPSKLKNYFEHIYTSLSVTFGENIISEAFFPETDSAQVLHQMHIFGTHQEEAFYNYEFPHSEVRSHMKESTYLSRFSK